MRDSNSEWKQQQDEEQEFNERAYKEESVCKQLNAMSDEEFYKWIGDIEMEVTKNV